MYCPNCGAQLPERAKFCASCCSSLADPAPQPAPAPNPVVRSDPFSSSAYSTARPGYTGAGAPAGALGGRSLLPMLLPILAAVLLLVSIILTAGKPFHASMNATLTDYGHSESKSDNLDFEQIRREWAVPVIIVCNALAILVLLLAAFGVIPKHPLVYYGAAAVALLSLMFFVIAWLGRSGEIKKEFDDMLRDYRNNGLNLDASYKFGPGAGGWFLMIFQVAAAGLAAATPTINKKLN